MTDARTLPDPWLRFDCHSCGWTTPGCYNFREDPALKGALPDSDCPKCGAHDGVVDSDQEVPDPVDVKAVIKDINSGPHYRFEPLTDDEILAL